MEFTVYHHLDPRDNIPFYVGSTLGTLAGRRSSGWNPDVMARIAELKELGFKIEDIHIKIDSFDSLATTDKELKEDIELVESSWKLYYEYILGYEMLNHNDCDHNGPVSMTDETKLLISSQQKGVPKPEGHGAKVSAAMKGKKKSPEHCKKMSEAQKGKTIPRDQTERAIATRANKTEEEKQEIFEKQSKSGKEWWENATKEEKETRLKNFVEASKASKGKPKEMTPARIAAYEAQIGIPRTEESKQKQKDTWANDEGKRLKAAEKTREQLANMTDEEKAEVKRKKEIAQRTIWENKSEEEKEEHLTAQRAGIKAYWDKKRAEKLFQPITRHLEYMEALEILNG